MASNCSCKSIISPLHCCLSLFYQLWRRLPGPPKHHHDSHSLCLKLLWLLYSRNLEHRRQFWGRITNLISGPHSKTEKPKTVWRPSMARMTWVALWIITVWQSFWVISKEPSLRLESIVMKSSSICSIQAWLTTGCTGPQARCSNGSIELLERLQRKVEGW